jgi:hypothetical protein
MILNLSRTAAALVFMVLPVWGHRAVDAQSPGPLAPESSREWTRVEGGPGTGCAGDSTFAFFVREGDPRKIMLFLNGGGACWNGGNCDMKGKPTFYSKMDARQDPAGADGVLQPSNPRNPVGDYSMVFVPYCTGDVHLGTREVTYRDSLPGDVAPRDFVIRHHGARNVERAVAWLTAKWTAPDIVFVTGSSAGAIPSPVYAADLARHYPRARVVQLGDGAGGYRAPAVPGILAGWGATDRIRANPAFGPVDSARLTFETLYQVAARATPRVRFAQYNNADDEIQVVFLNLLGMQGFRLPDLMRENLAEIRRSNEGFRSYTAPGVGHTILGSAEFYTLRVDDISLRDWLAALIGGSPVQDVGVSLLRKTP